MTRCWSCRTTHAQRSASMLLHLTFVFACHQCLSAPPSRATVLDQSHNPVDCNHACLSAVCVHVPCGGQWLWFKPPCLQCPAASFLTGVCPENTFTRLGELHLSALCGHRYCSLWMATKCPTCGSRGGARELEPLRAKCSPRPN